MSAAAVQALEQLERKASTTVRASALRGGTFTLPLNLFVADALETDRSLVPSLSFLLVHHHTTGGQRTNIVFDLGLRRDIQDYIPPIRDHLSTRQPLDTLPDVRQSLLDGGVQPRDICRVILSHVHWDHTGTPADFPHAKFRVGSGALRVLQNGLGGHLGHQNFESKLFDGLDVEEFSRPPKDGETATGWEKVGNFWMHDLMEDGSVYVVDAPGHLPGHLNLLARVAEGRWVYLAGDACHDRRLLTGEKEIAEWTDTEGNFCCIHTDKKEADATLARIRDLRAAGVKSGIHVDVILAHGTDWAEANPQAFLPWRI